MDRVETLLQKLQQQFTDKVNAAQLLLTAQMLQHELQHLQDANKVAMKKSVIVSMPLKANFISAPVEMTEPENIPEEKIIELLQVDEAAVEAELDEIKRNAATMQHISNKSKPQLLFDMDDDEIPTLPRQKPPVAFPKEINDAVINNHSNSVNEFLKETKTELSEALTDIPVKDLKKAIGVNDRFLYINELFRGDEVMYERSIKTINSFSIWPEAEYWIRRELKTKLGWIDTDRTVIQFDQLVKRRFA